MKVSVIDDALLRVDLDGDVAAPILRLTGQLDVSTAPLVDNQIRRLRESPSRHVVLDLHDLEFLDCAGVRPLARLSAELRAHRGSLKISGATTLVGKVLAAAELSASPCPPG